MNYPQTVDFLFSNLPLFQRTGPAAYKANLNNTLALDDILDHPHRKFKTIHIAGTNGKGSVSHMVAAILQTQGYKTGLFTSPHLIDFRERMRINGEMISEDYVCGFVDRNREVIEKISPSFFELTTLMAFCYFADSGVDIAVIETGMGGRLDSSNIITPLVSVITNIGLDHTQFLGDTLDLIAAEKAGIIKENVPVVIGEWQLETEDIFNLVSEKMESEIFFASDKYYVSGSHQIAEHSQVLQVESGNKIIYKNLALDLPGIYQERNVPTVLQTIDCLRVQRIQISRESIYEGLKTAAKTTGLRGRWEIINNKPLTICDTGHNAEGISEVVKQIRITPHRNLHFIFGTVNDKDVNKVLSLLPTNGLYYFTKADIPRALDPEILWQKAKTHGLNGEYYPSINDAYNAAYQAANEEDLVFIGGSTFVVGEFLKLFLS